MSETLATPTPPIKNPVMPAKRWGADLWIILCLCNGSMTAKLLNIWRAVAPLKHDRARAAMEAECRHTANGLRFFPPADSSPFFSPFNAWHMMHAKAESMGIPQPVIPFMECLRAATVEPQQGINSLTSMYLADTIPEQRQGIWTNLVSPHPPPPPSQGFHHQQSFQIPAVPAPAPTPTKKPVMPANRRGADHRSILRMYDSSRTAQLMDIWRAVAPLKHDRVKAAMEAA